MIALRDHLVRGSGFTISGCVNVWPFAVRRTVNGPVSIGCWRPKPPPPPPPRPAAGGGVSCRSHIHRCMPAEVCTVVGGLTHSEETVCGPAGAAAGDALEYDRTTLLD